MLELFEAKLPSIRRADDECWPYSPSAVKADWYGRVSCGTGGADFKQALSHRVSWTYFNGPLGDDEYVLHSCDYKPCVNPRHLHKGSQGENNAEAHARGRTTGAKGKTWKWATTENHWRNVAKREAS